jgi:hypothetical protein
VPLKQPSDVLIDANLKPWVLEVNSSPAMSIDTPLDEEVKGVAAPESELTPQALIRDIVELLHCSPIAMPPAAAVTVGGLICPLIIHVLHLFLIFL